MNNHYIGLMISCLSGALIGLIVAVSLGWQASAAIGLLAMLVIWAINYIKIGGD